MSKISDNVFNRLKAGETPEAIRSSVTSSSQFAKGIQQYLNYGAAEATRLQRENNSLAAGYKKLAEEVKTLTSQHGQFSSQVQRESEQLKGLNSQIIKAGEEVVSLQNQKKELEGKGYNTEIIHKLMRLDSESGTILQRVQTTQNYDKEISNLKTRKDALEKETKNLGNELSNIQSNITVKENHCRRLKSALKRSRMKNAYLRTC